MKRSILIVSLLLTVLFTTRGQVDTGFTSVPVVNGKVLFEQFILADQNRSADQNYALLLEWGKKRYSDSPLLSGIRFDDKARRVTVSSRAEIVLPENSEGVREEMIMNYRFDATISNAGCILVVRDITYQPAEKDEDSFFPEVYRAEESITDQALTAKGELGVWRGDLRRETLRHLNGIYSDLSRLL